MAESMLTSSSPSQATGAAVQAQVTWRINYYQAYCLPCEESKDSEPSLWVSESQVQTESQQQMQLFTAGVCKDEYNS